MFSLTTPAISIASVVGILGAIATFLVFKGLNQHQKTVFKGVIAALFFSTVFVAIAYFFVSLPLPVLDTAEQRLIFTLRWQIFPALMLFAGVAAIGNERFLSPAINPLAGVESDKTRVHLRYLSNTLEQFVLFFVASLILSTFLDNPSIKLIPILATLFVFGRIAFWLGYLQNSLYRAFGMGVTLYPTAAILFYDTYRMLGG
ncbi:MAG: MAPEG family protein [Cyanobacteriota bacterium]